MSSLSEERLAAIETDLDRRIPAVDLADRDHCRGLLAEVRRLRAIEDGVEVLTRVGYDHTPDCVKEQEQARRAGESFWHPDCGRCWEDSLNELLNPTEGGTDHG